MKKEQSAKQPGLTPGLGSAPQPPPAGPSARRMAIGSPEPVPGGATEPLIGRPAAPGKPADKAVRQVREVAAAVKRRQAGQTKAARRKR